MTRTKQPWNRCNREPTTKFRDLEYGPDDNSGETSEEVSDKAPNSQSPEQEPSDASDIDGDVDETMVKIKIKEVLQTPSPGLTLRGSGIVGLPLYDVDADRIRQEANPRGCSSKTSGGSCVLGPDLFELRNPDWNPFIRNLASRILMKTPELLRVQLVNLVLQEQIRSEPELPSYSDVQQTFKPLLSGTRLQLTYSVFATDIETANGLVGSAQGFKSELSKWEVLRKSSDLPQFPVYVLDDHADKNKALRFSSLTAVDFTRTV
ncbi:MAG: hypothetical protein Q9170_005659 [Blastenia crenularia]